MAFEPLYVPDPAAVGQAAAWLRSLASGPGSPLSALSVLDALATARLQAPPSGAAWNVAVSAVRWAVSIRHMERYGGFRYVDLVGDEPEAGRLPLPRVDLTAPSEALEGLVHLSARGDGIWTLPAGPEVPAVLRLAVSALEGYRPPEAA